MKANEFVKKFGFEHAKYLLEDTTLEYFEVHSQCAGKYFEDTVCVNDIERLVESHAMIEKDFESVEIAKYEYMVSGCYSEPYWIRIKQAIADVESCL